MWKMFKGRRHSYYGHLEGSASKRAQENQKLLCLKGMFIRKVSSVMAISESIKLWKPNRWECPGSKWLV
jgi:hypothetical protein